MLHKVQVSELINEITVESCLFGFFSNLSKYKEHFKKIRSYFFPMMQVPCNLFCRGMQQLLDYPEDDIEEAFCLNFTVSYNCLWSVCAKTSAANSH